MARSDDITMLATTITASLASDLAALNTALSNIRGYSAGTGASWAADVTTALQAIRVAARKIDAATRQDSAPPTASASV